MKLSCQHCATPYKEGTGDGAFCCSGCRQVYELIRAEDLGDYYALQDRVGRPVGDALGKAEDLAKLKRLQADAERADSELTLRVDGMSCLGCVWLVERISRAMPGVQHARVSLQENRLALKWHGAGFDLPSLATRLHAFGYALSDASSGLVAQWSLLTWRVLLSAVFAVNAVLLAIPNWFSDDLSPYANIFALLSLLFVALSFTVGGSHFAIPVLRSWRLRLLHYDSLPVLGLLSVVTVGLVDYSADADISALWQLPLLIFLLLAVRWIHLRVWAIVSSDVDSVGPEAAKSAQRWVGLLVVASVAIAVGCGLWLQSDLAAILFSTPLYPLALIGRYQSEVRALVLGGGLCVCGWAVVVWFGLGAFSALGWCLFAGLLMFVNFVGWNRRVQRI